MKPLLPAVVDATEIETTANALLEQWEQGNETLRALTPGITRRGDALAIFRKRTQDENTEVEYFLNDTYQVARRVTGDSVWLSIKRLDREACKDWRDFQEIKNQLIGPECEAIELYPAESRLVDTSTQYHLWGIRDNKFRFPFGFNQGRVVTSEPLGKAKQRPIT